MKYRTQEPNQTTIAKCQSLLLLQKFSVHLSTKCLGALWLKVKELGIGKSKSETPVFTNFDIINDYFVDIPIDFSGAVCLIPVN